MIDLIAMLDGVKETGPNRWIARCPAHDDNHPSLFVTLTDDGIWLLKCWAGCYSIEIVRALGIEFADLFPNSRIRRIDHREKARMPALHALKSLDHEIHVALILLNDVCDHKQIDSDTLQRLTLCCSRIGNARVACGIRP